MIYRQSQQTAKQPIRSKVGVDTIHVLLEDVVINTPNSLTRITSAHRQGRKNVPKDQVLWHDDEGNPVLGLYAGFRSQNFRVRIFPMSPEGRPGGAYLCWSLPKYCRGDNSYRVTQVEFVLSLLRLEDELALAGIKANLWRAKTCCIHLFQDFITVYPVPEYVDTIAALHMAYSKFRRCYPSGVTHGNKRNQIGFYAKATEIMDRGCVPNVHPNTLRVEARFRKALKVRTALGFSTLGDLVRNYDCLESIFQDTLVDYIFRDFPKQQKPEIWCKAAKKFLVEAAKPDGFAGHMRTGDLSKLYADWLQFQQNHASESMADMVWAGPRECLSEAQKVCVSKRRQRLSALLLQSPNQAPLYHELHNHLVGGTAPPKRKIPQLSHMAKAGAWNRRKRGPVWTRKMTFPKARMIAAMVDCADKEGVGPFSDLSPLASQTGYNERRVREIITELIKTGLVVEQKDGAGQVINWKLNLAAAPPKRPYRKWKMKQRHRTSEPKHDAI